MNTSFGPDWTNDGYQTVRCASVAKEQRTRVVCAQVFDESAVRRVSYAHKMLRSVSNPVSHHNSDVTGQDLFPLLRLSVQEQTSTGEGRIGCYTLTEVDYGPGYLTG